MDFIGLEFGILQKVVGNSIVEVMVAFIVKPPLFSGILQKVVAPVFLCREWKPSMGATILAPWARPRKLSLRIELFSRLSGHSCPSRKVPLRWLVFDSMCPEACDLTGVIHRLQNWVPGCTRAWQT